MKKYLTLIVVINVILISVVIFAKINQDALAQWKPKNAKTVEEVKKEEVQSPTKNKPKIVEDVKTTNNNLNAQDDFYTFFKEFQNELQASKGSSITKYIDYDKVNAGIKLTSYEEDEKWKIYNKNSSYNNGVYLIKEEGVWNVGDKRKSFYKYFYAADSKYFIELDYNVRLEDEESDEFIRRIKRDYQTVCNLSSQNKYSYSKKVKEKSEDDENGVYEYVAEYKWSVIKGKDGFFRLVFDSSYEDEEGMTSRCIFANVNGKWKIICFISCC